MPRRILATVPDAPGRAVAYLRVSALMGRGGDDFHSPELQLGAIRRVMAPAGLREVAVIEDIDRSGRHFAREGIEKIRELAEARQIDAVAIFDVSRLGRNVLESLRFLAWLAERGVAVISASEQVDTSTPAGKLMLTNMMAIAEYRSNEIGKSWSAVIERRAENGHHHGNALGYVRKNKVLVPHPVLGPAMTAALTSYADGLMMAEICRRFALAKGGAVIAANLKKCFRNPVYLGHVVAAGRILPGSHPALIDAETWKKVQDRLARDAGTPPRHLRPTWALVGITYCPAGHHLQRVPFRERKTGSRYDRLMCGMGPGRAVAGSCVGVGAPVMADIETKVLAELQIFVSRLRSDHVEIARRVSRRAVSRAREPELRRELMRVREGIQRLAKGWALGDVPDSGYHGPMAELAEAERAIQASLDAAMSEGAGVDPSVTAHTADAIIQAWPDMLPNERNLALRALVDRVVVRKAAYWREPVADCVTVEWL
jgi:site-specific DNA recombinase